MTCCNSRNESSSLNERLKKLSEFKIKDIKIMSLSSSSDILDVDNIYPDLLNRHPFLNWRVSNFRNGINIRGLSDADCSKCYLTLDDVTIAGEHHYPCNVYFREGGKPIGSVNRFMMQDRFDWFAKTSTKHDPICNRMCMDLLRTYNNRVHSHNKESE